MATGKKPHLHAYEYDSVSVYYLPVQFNTGYNFPSDGFLVGSTYNAKILWFKSNSLRTYLKDPCITIQSN